MFNALPVRNARRTIRPRVAGLVLLFLGATSVSACSGWEPLCVQSCTVSYSTTYTEGNK